MAGILNVCVSVTGDVSILARDKGGEMSESERCQALQRIMDRYIEKMLAAIERALESDSTQDHWEAGATAEETVHYGNLMLGRMEEKREGAR